VGDRPRPTTDSVRQPDALAGICDRAPHGFRQLFPQREQSREGRGQGAATAVNRPASQTPAPPLVPAFADEKQIEDLFPVQVSSGDERGAAAATHQGKCGLAHRRLVSHRDSGKPFGLGEVRGDDRGERRQLVPHCA